LRASTIIVGLALTTSLAACGDNISEDPCDQPGVACVWAGTGVRGFNNTHPDADKLESKLYFPSDLTFGPDGRAYIADWNNHRVRRVEDDNRLTVVVGTDYEGDGPPNMEDRLPQCAPPGALGTTVAMNHMTDAKFGPDGKLYIAAWHNNKIRVYDPNNDVVTVLAGDGYGYAGTNEPACTALFNQPKAIAFAPDGTIYTIDQRNVRIRKIATDPDRTISTFAGSGVLGDLGDGGQALDAQFGFETGTTPRPSGALLIDSGYMYVADSLNNRIRRINMQTNVIDCIAGSVEPGYDGDNGPALAAHLNFPADLELGPDGRLYVADRVNSAVRAIDLTTGTITTVIGGRQCDLGLDKCPSIAPANEMPLNEPYGIAFDPLGNLYVADTHNHRIIRVAR
jgi:DNA-binding beta-propeller fold protein YncE